MSHDLIEVHDNLQKLNSSISIRPYMEDKDNMGLEQYNMVLFEGSFHEEPVICLENNGILRYVTGLNEFAPEIKELDDLSREATIKQIRVTVSQLEKDLASNVIDPTDKDFWEKVILLKPNNSEFWDKISLKVGNEPVFLAPAVDPYDVIKIKAIEAGGFSLIAPSLDAARKSHGAFKFYLDRYEETASVRTEVKKLRNKALAALQTVFDKNTNKLFYICKVIDGNSTQYKKSTPNDIMYDNMDAYINGETVERNKKKTAETFLAVADLDMEVLRIRSMVKDANYYKIIANRSDGHIYHMSTNTLMGRNASDVIEYLKNPLNEEILDDITKNVEKYWNL